MDERNTENTVFCTSRFKSDSDKYEFIKEKGFQPLSSMVFGWNFKSYIEEHSKRWDVFDFHLPNSRGPLLCIPKRIASKTQASVHTTAAGRGKYLYAKTPFSLLSWTERGDRLGLNRLSLLLESRAIARASRIVSCSHYVKRELLELYGKSGVHVIYNGIDTSKLRGPHQMQGDDVQILFVGRFVAQKGLFWGIDALSMLNRSYRFLVAGQGPLKKDLEQHCRRRGVEAEFLGYVEDDHLFKLYAESDTLLLPSLYEGFPVVGLEAAGSGMAIAASAGARIAPALC